VRNETVTLRAAAPISNGHGAVDAKPAFEQPSVLQEAIRTLVAERQRMRDCGLDRRQLESNRLQLVRLQWQLSYALIRCHQPRGCR
jgi:hypothetical protein